MITFANDVLAVCETGWILPAGHPSGSDQLFVIQGTEGRLEVNLQQQGIVLSTEARAFYPDTTFMPWVHGELRSGFVEETRHFVHCVRDGKQPLITGHDATVALAMAEAIMESAHSHMPVSMIG